jgi:hypothetical protein
MFVGLAEETKKLVFTDPIQRKTLTEKGAGLKWLLRAPSAHAPHSEGRIHFDAGCGSIARP